MPRYDPIKNAGQIGGTEHGGIGGGERPLSASDKEALRGSSVLDNYKYNLTTGITPTKLNISASDSGSAGVLSNYKYQKSVGKYVPPPPKTPTLQLNPQVTTGRGGTISSTPFWKTPEFLGVVKAVTDVKNTILSNVRGASVPNILQPHPAEAREALKALPEYASEYYAPRPNGGSRGRGPAPVTPPGGDVSKVSQETPKTQVMVTSGGDIVLGNSQVVYGTGPEGELVPFTTEAGRPAEDLAYVNEKRASGFSDVSINLMLTGKRLLQDIGHTALILWTGAIQNEWTSNNRNPSVASATLQYAFNAAMLAGEAIKGTLAVESPIKRDAVTGKLIVQFPIRLEDPKSIAAKRSFYEQAASGQLLDYHGNPIISKEKAEIQLRLLAAQEAKMLSDHQRTQDAWGAFSRAYGVFKNAWDTNSSKTRQQIMDLVKPSGNLPWNASMSDMKAALNTEPSYGAGNAFDTAAASLFKPIYTVDANEIKSLETTRDELQNSAKADLDALNAGKITDKVIQQTGIPADYLQIGDEIAIQHGLPKGSVNLISLAQEFVRDATRVPTVTEVAEQVELNKREIAQIQRDPTLSESEKEAEISNIILDPNALFQSMYEDRMVYPSSADLNRLVQDRFGISADVDKIGESLTIYRNYEPTIDEISQRREEILRTRQLSSIAYEDIRAQLIDEHTVTYEREITMEEAKALSQSALDKIKQSQQIQLGLMQHDPSAAATWIREPDRAEAYYNFLAQIQLQTGRFPTDREIREAKSMFANAGTEMAAEMVFDVTNFLPGLEVLEAIPGINGAKAFFKESIALKALDAVKEIPVVGWFFRQSNSTVATKLADGLNDIINKMGLAYPAQIENFITDLPKLGDNLRLAIGKSDDDVMKLWRRTIEPSDPMYVKGMENIPFERYKALRDLASVKSGGIDPATWGEIYRKAVAESEQEVLRNAKRSVMLANPGKTEAELAAQIDRVAKDVLSSPTHLSNASQKFSTAFKEAFLSSHRISIDASGKASQLLDDTLIGQITQKLRLMGDRLEELPAYKALQNAIPRSQAYDDALAAFNQAKKEMSMTPKQKKELWAELYDASTMKKLDFGERVNKMFLEAGREYTPKFRKTLDSIADGLEMGNFWAGRMYEAWAMAVLSLNPRWFIQNLVDTSGRSFIFGGNPLEDISMLMFGTHAHLAEQIGTIPIELGQNLARSEVDKAFSVPYQFLEGSLKFDPDHPLRSMNFGPFSMWKNEYARIAQEGISNMQDTPAVIARLLEKNNISPAKQWMKDLRTRMITGLAAIPGAASDFNTAIEFTVRLRMFSREYFKIIDEFDGVFKGMETEAMSPQVKRIVTELWNNSGNNPSKMSSMVNNLISDVASDGRKLTDLERRDRAWSMLFNEETDKALKNLTSQEKQVFLSDIGSRFDAYRAALTKNGKSVLEPTDINKFVDDMQLSITDEIQERISKMNESLGRNIDGIGVPDEVPHPPKFDEAANYKGGHIPPPSTTSKAIEKPTRKTGNTSISDLVQKVNTFFSAPPPKGEAVAASRLRDMGRSAKSIVDSFGKAMESYGTVKMVPGDGLKVALEGGEVVISLGEDLLTGSSKGKLVPILSEAVIRTKATRDIQLLESIGYTVDDYVAAVKLFMTPDGPAEVMVRDKNLFLAVAGEFYQDGHYKKLLENINHTPISWENTRILEKRGMNMFDLTGEGWKDLTNKLEDAFSSTPYEVRVRGLKKGSSTLRLRDYIINPRINDSELVAELEHYLGNVFVADGQLDKFMYTNVPGPFRARGLSKKLQSQAWDNFWDMKGRVFEMGTSRNDAIEALLKSGDYEEAKRVIEEFNDNFSDKYLESVGFDIIHSADGGVEAFTVQIGGSKAMKGRPLASDPMKADWDVKQMYESFFAPLSQKLWSRDTTVNIDTTKLLTPGKEARQQIDDALQLSFKLNRQQSKAYSKTIMEHVDFMSTRSGVPVEDLLKRIGFARQEGALRLQDGLELARSSVPDDSGRFVFYGFGEKNFTALTNQMSEMFYTDLVFLAKTGDAQAIDDLRNIKNLIGKLGGGAVPEGKLGEKLTLTQSQHFSDLFTKWVESGVTENPKLKTTFEHFRNDYISAPYKNIVADNVLNDTIDADMLMQLDRAFSKTELDKVPSTNSFAIRAMANKSGINLSEKELLDAINNHGAVTGMTDKAAFVKSLVDMGQDKEYAENFHSLLKAWSDASGTSMNKIHVLSGEAMETNPTALYHAIKTNPLMNQEDLQPEMIQRMVDSIFRNQENRKLPALPDIKAMLNESTSNNEKLLILAYVDEHDTEMAQALWKEYNGAGKLFQQGWTLEPGWDKGFTELEIQQLLDEKMITVSWDKGYAEYIPGDNLVIYRNEMKLKNIMEQDPETITDFIVSNRDKFPEMKDLSDQQVFETIYKEWMAESPSTAKFRPTPVKYTVPEKVTMTVKAAPAKMAKDLKEYGKYILKDLQDNDPIFRMIADLKSKLTGQSVKDDMAGKLLQRGMKAPKGAYEMVGGEHFLYLFEKADPTTAVHELGHATLADLALKGDERIRIIERWAGVEEGTTAALKEKFDIYHNLKKTLEGNVTPEVRAEYETIFKNIESDALKYTAMHEKFANGMITYLQRGIAPTPQLKGVFEYFKQVLSDLWNSAKKMFVDLPEEVIPVYDSLFYTATHNLDIPRRYSSLGDVPVEIAQKVFKTKAEVKFADELNAAFSVWKMRRGLEAFPAEATTSYDVFKQFLKSKIDRSTGEIENQYRSILWELEQFSNTVSRYHYGDELVENLIPAIPDNMIGDSIKTVISHNKDNMRVYDSMLAGLESMRRDWLKRANGGFVGDFLTEEEKKALKEWAPKAVGNKSNMMNLAVNGGEVKDAAGKVIAKADGALPKTNHVLLDYTNRTNFDSIMKMFFPFWMFPSRSLPFWAQTLTTHPEVAAMYFKLKRASEGQRYQAGAIDSTGRPISSLDGYVKISDMWVNPLAPFSFRYLLDITKYADARNYETPDEESLTGIPYLVKEFMQSAPILGFNVAPWMGAFLKYELNIPDSIMPGWALVPQLNLIPKWAVKPMIENIKNPTAKRAVSYWMFPEPNWQDSLVEKRILEKFAEDAQGMNKSEFDAYRIEVVNATKEKGTNPLWLKTYKELTQEDATRNFRAFFTGVYGKSFTDGAADLISLKIHNNALNYAMNNDFIASEMELPVDDQERWDYRQSLRNADTPDAWAARLYKDIGWVKNSDGKVVNDPKERAKLLAAQIDTTENSRQLYYAYKNAKIQLDADLATLARVGSPSGLTKKYYDKYFATLAALNKRSPNYQFVGSSKPVSLIEGSLRDEWWYVIKSTMPSYDFENETYVAYEMRVEQWKASLPQIGDSLMSGKSFVETYTSVFGALNEEQRAQFNPKFMANLLAETNAQGYAKYRLENDNIYDAANEVWKLNYWNKYWDALGDLKGEERKMAAAGFYGTNPEPDEKTIYTWIQQIYGNRFTLGEIQTLMGANVEGAMSIQERLDYNKSPEELARNQIWDMLSMAGPSTQRDKLVSMYDYMTGEGGDIDVWYETEGLGFNYQPEKLISMRDNLLKAANQINLKAPDKMEMMQRVKAEDLNDLFKVQVSQKFGETFLQNADPVKGLSNGLYPYYSGMAPARQTLWRKDPANSDDYKQIQEYKAFRKTYAKENPLWSMYYYEYVPVKKQGLTTAPTVLTPGQKTQAGRGAVPPPMPPGSNNFSKGKTPSKLTSVIPFPKGFSDVAGDEIVGEINDLVRYGKWMSQPAKDYLYNLAKRRKNWRGFIYSVLSK